jgi:5'(3')-deoxyribonucleotidase
MGPIRKRLIIDMDETIADSLPRQLEWFERDAPTPVLRDQLQGQHLHQFVGEEHVDMVRSYAHHEDFFRDLPLLDGAQEALEKLSEKYDIYIATAAMEFPLSFAPKYEWLRLHFPFISPMRYIFCGDKSVLKADYLIDDTAKHLEGFHGEGLLFTAPHNIHEDRFRRVDSWSEVLALLLPA